MKPILGGAVGATSVLMIRSHADDKTSVQENPKGICIAILANIQDCGGLLDLAIDLAEVFEKNNLLRNWVFKYIIEFIHIVNFTYFIIAQTHNLFYKEKLRITND